MRRPVRLPPAVVLLLLAGCAAVPERAPVSDAAVAWEARRATLAQIGAWELRGRVAVRTADQGGQASLLWKRENDTHRIDLVGPLGSGRVRLTQDRNGAELRDGSGKVYRGASVQDLLARMTGWKVPLEGLNYWALGLPTPDAITKSELDEWGRLKTLEQLGWDIHFLDYAPQGNYELPSRVFISRKADSPDAAVEVRLVVEKWTVDQATR